MSQIHVASGRLAAVMVRLALVAAGLSLPGLAQVDTEVTHTFPFTSARVVVSEKIGSNPAVIYEGAGAGIFVLDGTSLEPVLKSGVANQLRAGGLVRDLTLTENHLYAAVNRGGIARFTKGSTDDQANWIWNTGLLGTHPWSIVAPVNLEDTDLLIVGTNDDYYSTDSVTGGKVHLVHTRTDDNSSPVRKATLDLGAPVYSLATRLDSDTLTLLVGTACRQVSGNYASLLRYDFDVSTDLPEAFPSPTATWNPVESSQSVPTFIRDIVIDPTAEVAYVAAWGRGVYKLDISSTLAAASGDWPITSGTLKARYNSLALYDGSLGTYLGRRNGPGFRR